MYKRTSTVGSVKLVARLLLSAAVSTVILGGATGCQQEQVNPFEPRKLGQLQRDASKGKSAESLGNLSSSYEQWRPRNRRSPSGAELSTRPSGLPGTFGNEPLRPMTLQAVINSAVLNNLEIKAAGYSPSIEAARILEAQARFDPVFFSNAGAEVTNRRTGGSTFTDPATLNNPFGATTFILDRQRVQQFTLESGVRQVLESGGQVQASYRLRQTDQQPDATFVDPFREADLILQLTQPLLRDFGGVVNRARIDIARNNQRISLLEFRQTTEEQLFNLEQAYWQLVSAQMRVANFELLLKRTEDTVEQLGARAQNDATIKQLAQAQADAASRRAQLVRARSDVRDLSDQIKVLMNDPDLPEAGIDLIVAQSPPLAEPVTFDFNQLVDTAMMYRLELAQQQLRVDNATITLGAARNNLLPQLNFVGSLNPSGGNDEFGGANQDLSDFNKISYSAGLQFEVPIGNREARAIYVRTAHERTRGTTQYQSLVNQVIADISIQHRQVVTTWRELQNQREARFAAERALASIDAQVDAGEGTNPFFIRDKLDQQARVADAQNQEAAALAAYNIAITRLERSKGTLLKYNNVSLTERGTPKIGR